MADLPEDFRWIQISILHILKQIWEYPDVSTALNVIETSGVMGMKKSESKDPILYIHEESETSHLQQFKS